VDIESVTGLLQQCAGETFQKYTTEFGRIVRLVVLISRLHRSSCPLFPYCPHFKSSASYLCPDISFHRQISCVGAAFAGLMY